MLVTFEEELVVAVVEEEDGAMKAETEAASATFETAETIPRPFATTVAGSVSETGAIATETA